ncbi:MAG: flavin reductase family protein [Chloroflexi bacterium]|nr:flavin reductase family protein [Chloroflexota bacterium]
MSERSLVKASVHLPCSVVIVSASASRKQGAMTASAMYVSQSPPLLAVSLSKSFATYQLIEASREFAVNVIADSQSDLARKFGKAHGDEVNKFEEFGIKTEGGAKTGAPLIAGCFANIECRVKSSLWEVEGNHAVYIAEVVGFKLNRNLTPLVWLAGKYFSVGAECRI